MDFAFIDPPLPSLSRWRRMAKLAPGQSVLRALEYEVIAGLAFEGDVLDFGGGADVGYAQWFDGAHVSSVNIDEEFRPTHVVAPGDPLPFAEGAFDAVVTFNTLEHVYDDIAALHELVRVLKPGASLHIVVPFLFRVHGHPFDYNRHTPSWWEITLRATGCRAAWLTPLVFGRRTTAQLVAGRGGRVIRPVTSTCAACVDILAARIKFAGDTTYTGRKAEKVWSQSPGWYIRAEK